MSTIYKKNIVSADLHTDHFNVKKINNLFKLIGINPRVGYTKFSKLLKSLDKFPWSWTEDMLYVHCEEWCLEYGMEIVSETICDNGTVIIEIESSTEAECQGRTWYPTISIEAKGSPDTRRKAITKVTISFILPKKGYLKTGEGIEFLLEARWCSEKMYPLECTLKARETMMR